MADAPRRNLKASDSHPRELVAQGYSLLVAFSPQHLTTGSGGSRGETYLCPHCESVVATEMTRMDVREIGYVCPRCRGVSFADDLPEPTQPRHFRPRILVFHAGGFGIPKPIELSNTTTPMPERSLAQHMQAVKKKTLVYSDEVGIRGDVNFGTAQGEPPFSNA